jgi:FMN phosphatase YigB (HAD superfamily)
MVPAMEAGWRTAWVRRPTDVAPSSRTGKPEARPEGSQPPDAETGDLTDLLDLLGVTQPAR